MSTAHSTRRATIDSRHPRGRSGTGDMLRRARLVLTTIAVTTLLVAWSAPAIASQQWRIDSLSNTAAQPGGLFDYRVQLTNVGDAPMDGSTITLTVTLAPGLSVADPAGPVGTDPANPHFNARNFKVFDVDAGGSFPCTAIDGSALVGGETQIRCENTSALDPFRFQLFYLPVIVGGGVAGTLKSVFEVSGGGATADATVDPTTVSSVDPGFGVDAFDGQVTANAAGDPFTQAGGHPYAASVAIDFATIFNPTPQGGPLWPVEPVKDVFVDLPPGLIGDPTSASRCTAVDLAHSDVGFAAKPLCSPTSQVGTALIRLNYAQAVLGPYPVYNAVPPANLPARFGMNILGTVIVFDAQLRSSGDYGLSVNVRNIAEALGIAGTTVTFWGVPSDASHDSERACPNANAPGDGGPTCSSGDAPKALLRNPTSCPEPGVGVPTTARIDSWTDPGDFHTATWFSHLPPAYPAAPEDWGDRQGTTGCSRVPFNPGFVARPASSKVASPSGFMFDLSMPQTSDPSLIGHGDLRKAVVTLPLGVRVSPSSADGLGACAPQQIALHDGNAPTCPLSSKIGSVTIDTPLLDDPLTGAIYLAKPNDNPFGALLSIYLVAEGPGLVIKLAGKVEADPISGQLTTTLDDIPQTPFSNTHLEFKGGSRAPLMTPKQCGTYTTHAELTSWSGRVVASDSSFALSHDGNGAPCPASQFSPGFSVGTVDPIAGKSSTLNLSFTRGDEDEELQAVAVAMPRGLIGKLANTDLCPERAARGGTCDDSSKIGSVTVGAGAGTNPFYITNGRAYITGPYKGAPFGVSIVVPAVAGPFDLGNVVVRAAIFVDKHTAELRVVSDPLPTTLQGIPLDVRDIRVSIDKPGFFLNPTSCEEKSIGGVVSSIEGRTANVSSRFQVGECASLSLKPRLTLAVGSSTRTRRGASTPLTATLRQTPRQSNLSSVRVTLPTVLNARLPVVNRACTRDQFEQGDCAKARAGTAVAVTPLLKDPLKGGVFFVRNGHPLPDLFVALRGQADFDLIGRVSIPGGKRLATTFDAVPDVPLTSFSLRLVAGRQGPVGAATNLCSAKARRAKAEVDFVGQNGRVVQVDQRLKIRGCPKSKPAKKAKGVAPDLGS